MQDELPNPSGRLKRQGLRMPECLAGAVRAVDSVQVCPYGPTCGGRLLSGFRRTVVSKEGISRCFFLGGGEFSFGEVRVGNALGERDVVSVCVGKEWGRAATVGSEGEKRAGVMQEESGTPMKPGKRPLNALGPATCLQTVAPTGISRRDSLPPLNAMPVVQVPQLVQCVLHKRDTADAGLSHIAPACGGRLLSDPKTGKKNGNFRKSSRKMDMRIPAPGRCKRITCRPWRQTGRGRRLPP